MQSNQWWKMHSEFHPFQGKIKIGVVIYEALVREDRTNSPTRFKPARQDQPLEACLGLVGDIAITTV